MLNKGVTTYTVNLASSFRKICPVINWFEMTSICNRDNVDTILKINKAKDKFAARNIYLNYPYVVLLQNIFAHK